MSNGEQKVDSVLGEVSALAEAIGAIPSPASVPLEVGGTVLTLVGPEVVHGLAILFHKLFHSQKPKEAGAAVLAAAKPVANNYVEYEDPDQLYKG